MVDLEVRADQVAPEDASNVWRVGRRPTTQRDDLISDLAVWSGVGKVEGAVRSCHYDGQQQQTYTAGR